MFHCIMSMSQLTGLSLRADLLDHNDVPQSIELVNLRSLTIQCSRFYKVHMPRLVHMLGVLLGSVEQLEELSLDLFHFDFDLLYVRDVAEVVVEHSTLHTLTLIVYENQAFGKLFAQLTKLKSLQVFRVLLGEHFISNEIYQVLKEECCRFSDATPACKLELEELTPPFVHPYL